MRAAERWHRDRAQHRAQAQEAARKAELAKLASQQAEEAAARHAVAVVASALDRDPSHPSVSATPLTAARPHRLMKRMSTLSSCIRERTKAMTSPSARPGASGAPGIGDVIWDEEDEFEDADDDADDSEAFEQDDADDALEAGADQATGKPAVDDGLEGTRPRGFDDGPSLGSTGSPGRRRGASWPTPPSVQPRSPAGARRVRCSLGQDTRMLLVPRGARFEEVIMLARAKFDLGPGETRLLCADPQDSTPAGEASAATHITLTSDADYEYMCHEHGDRLALFLTHTPAGATTASELPPGTPAQNGAAAPTTPPPTPRDDASMAAAPPATSVRSEELVRPLSPKIMATLAHATSCLVSCG